MRIFSLEASNTFGWNIEKPKIIEHNKFGYHQVLNAKGVSCENSSKQRGTIVKNGESKTLVPDADKKDQGIMLFFDFKYSLIQQYWIDLACMNKGTQVIDEYLWLETDLNPSLLEEQAFKKGKVYNNSVKYFNIKCNESETQLFEFCFAFNETHIKSDVFEVYFGQIILKPDKDLSISPIVTVCNADTKIKKMTFDLVFVEYINDRYSLCKFIKKTEAQIVELKNEYFEFLNK